ncbi:MAG: hypothetical protein KatS3mg051_1933 [Anaerolineae bacterium]|nr:MAG: hypothetical protein KatS3mg051_1933 [Anaerolineae bacterium]
MTDETNDMLSKIIIVMNAGALGPSSHDTFLDTAMRLIGLAAQERNASRPDLTDEQRSWIRLSWAEKYGHEWRNDTFMMHPYCWCDKDDCPWCGGCTCGGPYDYYVGDRPVDYYEYDDALGRLYAECGSVIEGEAIKEERGIRAVPNPNKPLCSFCTGELSREWGGEPGGNAPNFWHFETGLKVWWYKYIGRDMEVSGDITQIAYVLQSCLASLGMADKLSELVRQLYGRRHSR